jgi:hypothetical protein
MSASSFAEPYLVLVHGRNDQLVPHETSSEVFQALAKMEPASVRQIHMPPTSNIAASFIGIPNKAKVLFFDLEITRNPLDILSSGHASWRDAFSASSPIWNSL